MEWLLTLHSPISRLELLWHKGLKETEEQTAQLKHKPGPACCSEATLCKGHWLPLVLVTNITPPLFSRSQLEISIWSAHCSWDTSRTSSRKMQECDTNPLPPSSYYKAAHVHERDTTPALRARCKLWSKFSCCTQKQWQFGCRKGLRRHSMTIWGWELLFKREKVKSAFTALWLHWAFSFWSPAGCCVMPSPN